MAACDPEGLLPMAGCKCGSWAWTVSKISPYKNGVILIVYIGQELWKLLTFAAQNIAWMQNLVANICDGNKKI